MKKSGYAITIKAFLPCDVHKRGSVARADEIADHIAERIGLLGFLAVTETRKYRQKAEVPDEPADDGEDGPTPAMREGIEMHRRMTKGGDATSQSRDGLPPATSNDGPVADDRDGAALASVAERVAAGVADNSDPDAPAALRRRKPA